MEILALRTYTNCVHACVRELTALWRMKRTQCSARVSAVWVWHSRSYLLASVWCSARWEVFYSWLKTCSTYLHWSHTVQSRILLKWRRDTDMETWCFLPMEIFVISIGKRCGWYQYNHPVMFLVTALFRWWVVSSSCLLVGIKTKEKHTCREERRQNIQCFCCV